jgi:hypothetical protein
VLLYFFQFYAIASNYINSIDYIKSYNGFHHSFLIVFIPENLKGKNNPLIKQDHQNFEF